MRSLSSVLYDTEKVDQGDLNVKPEDLQPWKAWTVDPVKVGDIVETEVTELIETSTGDEIEGNGTKAIDTKSEQDSKS
jgi:hypothetical protein